MTANQKNQAYLYLGMTILSLVILLPNMISDLPKWWPGSKLNLGLDLRGGSYLVMGVQTDEAVKSQLTQMAQSIHSDLKKSGVIKAKAISDQEIEVTLLGEKGITELEAFVLKNYVRNGRALLTKVDQAQDGNKTKVRFAINEMAALEIKKDSVAQAIETVRNRIDFYGVAEPTIQRSGEEQIIVQLPNVTDLKAVKQTIGSVAKLEFRLVYDPTKTSPETSTIKLPRKEGGEATLEDEVLMSGDAIENATIDINPQTNEVEVQLKLNPIGKNTFDRITGNNVNRQLAIVLDKVVYSAPNINERISGGSAIIHGSFTKEEARQLAVVLRSGALPAPLKFLEERTVGASLGADSIHKGLVAAGVGAIVVILFMMMYYRKAGILANACVIVNVVMLMAVLALFHATLTLPGIAGLALTVGMAVDANVIIYERIREELRAGASVGAAIAAGYDKAHWTVMDSNLTTLLTGLVLFVFGTGPIRGFAVTLSIGIITTLITALWMCKLCFETIDLKDKNGKLSI